jgi:hypothetical protein
MHHDFANMHKTLRDAPQMEAGVSDSISKMDEIAIEIRGGALQWLGTLGDLQKLTMAGLQMNPTGGLTILRATPRSSTLSLLPQQVWFSILGNAQIFTCEGCGRW